MSQAHLADPQQLARLAEPGVRVAVLGIPLDENASFFTGPRLAPAAIRAVLHSGASNWAAEGGLELDQSDLWVDLGDLAFPGREEPFRVIRAAIEAVVQHDVRVFSLGGDHSVTYPILQALAPRFPEISILQIDAHPDLYDSFEGSRHSHACPFARIMEAGLARELVQVGIRTMNTHQREQADRFGVRVLEMNAGFPAEGIALRYPVYLSLDMDGLDPGFAPGVSHPEPGGPSVREVISLIQALDQPVVGPDLVEFNPERDASGLTGAVAAKLFKEILAKLLGG